jgi:hypothetical protein
MEMSNVSLVGYENMSCKSIYELYVTRYIMEFGEMKTIKVSQEIESNHKIKSYVDSFLLKNTLPNYIDIIAVLNLSPYFLLSKGETLCLASLIILEYWNEVCNESSKNFASKEVTGIAISIIHQCSRLKYDRADNLFTRFYEDIEFHLKLTQRKDTYSSEYKNYRSFIIKKSSGPFEFPLNLKPDVLCIHLELEFEGDIYKLTEEIFYDYFEEDLEKFQVNKKYMLKISNYDIVYRDGLYWLRKKS